MKRSFVLSLATLVGTMIGAGVFALPQAFARVGLWLATLLFALFTLLVAMTHSVYVDVVLGVEGSHRLPGYAQRFLGKRWAALAMLTSVAQGYGSHVIYLLLGGAFLQTSLFSTLSWGKPLGILLVFSLGALSLLGGMKRVAKIEALATACMVGLFILVSLFVARMPVATTTFAPHLSWTIFGLFLFALSGLPVISEVVELNRRDRHASHRAVIWGTILAGVIMWSFAVVFARMGGTLITQDPGSLARLLPSWAVLAIPLLGLLAIATSYITTAEDIQMMWKRDYGFSHQGAWLAVLVPPLLFALLFQDGFVLLATILGTVFGGMNGILVGMMRLVEIERGKPLTIALGVAMLIVFLYAFGLVGQIITWLFV